MTITIVAPACAFSGFGRTAIELFSRLSERGHTCKFMPVTVEEMLDGRKVDFPQVIKDSFVSKAEGVELVHTPLLWNHIPQTKGATIFTMYESTHIPKRHVDALNKYTKVVTPTEWNSEVFRDGGVTSKRYVANLGVDLDTFIPWQTTSQKRSLCVFGAAAWLKPSQRRKNFGALMTAWRAAFPGIKDVRLSLKALPGDSLPDFKDDRISVEKSFMQPFQLANWYRSLSAFVSASRCEGWNLMAHEAMACGVPIISHMEGAHRELLTRDACFPCWAKMVPHSKSDSEFGFDWEIDIDDLVDAMRFVHQDERETRMRGISAWKRAAMFSLERTVDRIEEVLNA
jgi:glycosyltransferase involved in cell wall biosynthesis